MLKIKSILLIFICTFLSMSSFAFKKPFIYQGDIVKHEEFPFVGQIYHLTSPDENGKQAFERHCVATVIAPFWLLTAAHCVSIDDPPAIFDAKTLKFSLDDGVHKLNIEKVFTYSPAGFDIDYDIALLKLEIPLMSKTISIPKHSNEFPNIKQSLAVLALGDGADDIQWVKYDNSRACPSYGAPCYFFYLKGGNFLRKGPGTTLNDADAQLKIKQAILYGDRISFNYNPATMLAVFSESGQHVLPGDSGGALLRETKAGYIQVGVTSWGPRLEGDGYAKEYREKDKIKVAEHLKSKPTFFANLLNKNILNFIYTTMNSN